MKLKRFGSFVNEDMGFDSQSQEAPQEVPGRAPIDMDTEMSASTEEPLEDNGEFLKKLKGVEASAAMINGEKCMQGDVFSIKFDQEEASFEITNLTDIQAETTCLKGCCGLIEDKEYMFYLDELEIGNDLTAYYEFASETNTWLKNLSVGTIESTHLHHHK